MVLVLTAPHNLPTLRMRSLPDSVMVIKQHIPLISNNLMVHSQLHSPQPLDSHLSRLFTRTVRNNFLPPPKATKGNLRLVCQCMEAKDIKRCNAILWC